MTQLATGRWLREHLNCLMIGPTGVGKTWLACALAQQACRQGFTAGYLRLPRLFRELAIAKGDGRYHKLLKEFAKTDLLILDDLSMTPLTDEQQRDLLEILDDRFNIRSSLVTSQLPLAHWISTSAIPRWPMPSLTGSYTTPTSSTSKENPCANVIQP